MKGFRKMDEMEKHISLKSLKIAYFYTITFLFVWVVIEYISRRTVSSSIAFFLLITQNLVLIFSQAYFKNKIGNAK
ncbi:hypothetical protein [Clostridium sp. C8-1-8]|uniref:hypothetical protein n=1 Tax=Clostridium sp. C8-1-8 TaxID=2698831 RepID=UPI00136FB68A|nr:hypothetical protein [Clostridium sp. C8-1-8]